MKLSKEKETKTNKAPCRSENRIIVRIWTSARNQEAPGENVGHVSIETTQPAGYMSLWPQGEPKLAARDQGFFKAVPHEFKLDAHADYLAEGRSAEVTVCLYSLNSELLSEKWETEKANLKGWVLIGSNYLINQGSGNNCSGLAYALLETAGIYHQLLSRGRFSSTFSSVVTPDALCRAVSIAKREELVSCPETVDFNYAGETPIDELPGKPANQGWCAIL